jgi:hypothetical protein
MAPPGGRYHPALAPRRGRELGPRSLAIVLPDSSKRDGRRRFGEEVVISILLMILYHDRGGEAQVALNATDFFSSADHRFGPFDLQHTGRVIANNWKASAATCYRKSCSQKALSENPADTSTVTARFKRMVLRNPEAVHPVTPGAEYNLPSVCHTKIETYANCRRPQHLLSTRQTLSERFAKK